MLQVLCLNQNGLQDWTYYIYWLILFLLSFHQFFIFVVRTVVITKPPVSGILFSPSSIFVLRTVATKPLAPSILFSPFLCKIVYLCCTDLSEFKLDASRTFFSKLFIFIFYCIELCVFQIYRNGFQFQHINSFHHLNHLPLFLNRSNQLQS